VRSLRWTDWAILACLALAWLIGSAGLEINVQTDFSDRGVMDRQ
jgi:hypothetical protein